VVHAVDLWAVACLGLGSGITGTVSFVYVCGLCRAVPPQGPCLPHSPVPHQLQLAGSGSNLVLTDGGLSGVGTAKDHRASLQGPGCNSLRHGLQRAATGFVVIISSRP
jgi:hypothetical protein